MLGLTERVEGGGIGNEGQLSPFGVSIFNYGVHRQVKIKVH